mgnify:CR=1 FL=1
MDATAPSGLRPPDPVPADRLLRKKAEELEAVFLAEMLAHAGLDPAGGAYGGGIGEEQFGSFMRMEQARQMVAAGGIGLAEVLFRAMGGQDGR